MNRGRFLGRKDANPVSEKICFHHGGRSGKAEIGERLTTLLTFVDTFNNFDATVGAARHENLELLRLIALLRCNRFGWPSTLHDQRLRVAFLFQDVMATLPCC